MSIQGAVCYLSLTWCKNHLVLLTVSDWYGNTAIKNQVIIRPQISMCHPNVKESRIDRYDVMDVKDFFV